MSDDLNSDVPRPDRAELAIRKLRKAGHLVLADCVERGVMGSNAALVAAGLRKPHVLKPKSAKTPPPTGDAQLHVENDQAWVSLSGADAERLDAREGDVIGVVLAAEEGERRELAGILGGTVKQRRVWLTETAIDPDAYECVTLKRRRRV